MHSVSRQLVDHAVPAHFPQSHAPKENDAKKIKLSDSQSLTSSNACCVRGCSTIFDAKSKVIGFKYVSCNINQLNLFNKKWKYKF